jgi:amidophosphoribosyltransferase
MASAAPPVRYPNVYGIDMPAPEEFVAHNRTVDDIAQEIGADWLIYQDIDDLVEAVRKGNDNLQQFDSSCFDGNYVTQDIDENYFRRLELNRNDAAKMKRRRSQSAETVEL